MLCLKKMINQIIVTYTRPVQKPLLPVSSAMMTISIKPPSGFFVATAVTIAALTAAVYTDWRFRGRRSKRGDDGKNLDFKDGSEESLVNERFQACVRVMGPQLSILPQQTQLDYYGLYKQGTLGDCSEYQSEPPPSYDLVASAKYQTWVRLGGMDRMTAMQNYIEKALHYQFIKNIGEGEDQDYELEGDPAIDMMGLGDKPSTLVDEYEYEKDVIALEDSQYPIHAAAREGDFDGLKKFLEAFASDTTTATTTSSVITTTGGGKSNNTNHLQHSPNTLDFQGQTPLHLATDRGHVECVKALILAGADINAVDHDGISILQTAVIVGEDKCCRLLLVLGADPDHEDNDGDTPRGSAQDDTKLKPLFQNHENGTLLSFDQDLFDPSFLEELKRRKIFVASIETTETETTVACTATETLLSTEVSSTKPEEVNVKNDIKTLDEPIDLELDDDGDMF